MKNPKVFLSHASEDKERFVNDFAARLRKNGIDVWLDKWEMLPGDSLVDKIFEEGLKEAEAVVIVLSKHSVVKPWVREELNSTIVNRIQNGTRLIPVIIDKCEVPESLKSTLWEAINDTENYDDSYERVLASILGTSIKPELGPLPSYALSVFHEINGLEPIDNFVLKKSCESLKDWPYAPIQPESIFANELENPPKAQVLEALDILEDEYLIEVSRYIGGGKERWGCHYRLTLTGYEEYCKTYVENYIEIQNSVAAAIVNENFRTNIEISEKLDLPFPLATHIIKQLESAGYVSVSGEIGTRLAIYDVSSKLRRALR